MGRRWRRRLEVVSKCTFFFAPRTRLLFYSVFVFFFFFMIIFYFFSRNRIATNKCLSVCACLLDRLCCNVVSACDVNYNNLLTSLEFTPLRRCRPDRPAKRSLCTVVAYDIHTMWTGWFLKENPYLIRCDVFNCQKNVD